MPQGTATRACRVSALRGAAVLLVAVASGAAAYQARVIHAAGAGPCTLRLEADEEARTLRLRVVPEGASCGLSRDVVQGFLREAFARTVPQPAGAYASLSLGRLVDYPWLSAQLATASYDDRAWDRTRGQAASGDVNAYVAGVLSRREVMAQIDAAIVGAGYRLTSAHVEKVLVGGLGDVPGYDGPVKPGRIPFDAQVWFGLRKVQASTGR